MSIRSLAEEVHLQAKKYPYLRKFDLRRLRAEHTDTHEVGKGENKQVVSVYPTWEGERGDLLDAGAGAKKQYSKVCEMFNQEAAKEWAWFQGYRVSVDIDYLKEFSNTVESTSNGEFGFSNLREMACNCNENMERFQDYCRKNWGKFTEEQKTLSQQTQQAWEMKSKEPKDG